MLSLSPAGVISGTPTNAGTSNFIVTVKDTLNQSDTQSLSIAVNADKEGPGKEPKEGPGKEPKEGPGKGKQ
jgi:hypothetical protein